MKITQRGPADADLSQVVKNEKKVSRTIGESKHTVQHGGDSAKVRISDEARELQRIAELARTGDQMRAEKVKQIKEQVEKGTYQASSEEVAQSIIRSEVARLLEKK
jgi:negative regulator of flagellin synthesis FlgM